MMDLTSSPKSRSAALDDQEVEITPNQGVDNDDLEGRSEKQRPKWYYNAWEDVQLELLPQPREMNGQAGGL